MNRVNHVQHVFPGVPASSYFAIGAGSSFTWIEPERRMVLVVRWIDADHATHSSAACYGHWINRDDRHHIKIELHGTRGTLTAPAV